MNFESLLNNFLTLKAFYYFTNDKYAVIIVKKRLLHEKLTKCCVKGKGRRGNGAVM